MKFHTLTYHANAGNPLSASNTGANFLNGVVQKLSVFFQKIQKEGIIEVIPHQKGIFHIRIINYDFWTGSISPEAREEKKKEQSEFFNIFWNKYHETMQKPKVNVARARREWDKLAKEEQQTAIDRIEEVYYHTNDTRFIPLASTYLKDKAFLNEYTN